MDTSIIIPTYNGGELLRRTLKAIYAQKTALSFEVIAVDSGSGPETIRILKGFPVRLIEIPNHEFNHGLTRDLGASKAEGEYLVFINQDAEPGDCHWLELMVKPLMENRAAAAAQGGIRERDDMPRFFWTSVGERFYFTSESKNWIQRYHNMGFSTINCAIRRAVWEQHHFGDMYICEDKAFQRRVQVRGDEIVYAEGWVCHSHDYNFSQLRKRCRDEGYGWHLLGEEYSCKQAVRDTLILKNYTTLVRGILAGKVKKWSEIVYPVLRPWWVYGGNHLTDIRAKSERNSNGG